PIPAAVRERFGFSYYVWPLIAGMIVDFLVLASEIGGVCIALQFLTGIKFQFWAIPVAVVAWATLWYGTFDKIEYGVSLLGLVTISFVVGAILTRPPIQEMARHLLPSWPTHHPAHYGFLAVSIIGSII